MSPAWSGVKREICLAMGLRFGEGIVSDVVCGHKESIILSINIDIFISTGSELNCRALRNVLSECVCAARDLLVLLG